jgi:hypothetical protein
LNTDIVVKGLGELSYQPKWWYSLKQGDSLAKTKFVSSIMSNIFGCSARMVANRSRVWKVMTSLMMNFDRVICETCDQWYHAGCQNIHTLSYDQLGDSELNISWHCIICNNPNYSYTVHDYKSIEITSVSNKMTR